MTQNERSSTIKVLVVNDTRVDGHHGCVAVMSAIDSLLKVNSMKPILYWPAHRDWTQNTDFHAAVDLCDLILINGEGTIHNDKLAGRRLLEIGIVAKENNVPIALINTGWHNNSKEIVSLLDHFDLISARDSYSAERMSSQGANVRVVPDLSLWYVQNNYEKNNENTKPNKVGFTDNVDRHKALLLAKLCEEYQGKKLSIVYSDKNFMGCFKFVRDGVALSQDYRTLYRMLLIIKMRYQLWKKGNPNTENFIREIDELKLLVSGRFHACTIALATLTPFIAQASNTDKISSLLYDAGLEDWRCSTDIGDKNVYRAQANGWSKKEISNLKKYLEKSLILTEQLFHDLADIARKR